MFSSAITNIYTADNLCLVTIANVASKMIAQIFTEIADNGINFDMITQTPPYQDTVNVSFTVSEDDFAKILPIVGKYQNKYPGIRTDLNCGNSKILIYGKKMVNTPGVAASALSILTENGIDIKLITTSDFDISLLVDSTNAEKAYELLMK